MRDVVTLFLHLIVVLVRLPSPRGFRSVAAESVLVRHQLLILNRGRKRAPNLRAADRIIAGLCTLFMRPERVPRSAVVLKAFHSAASPQLAPQTKVSPAVFTPARASIWTEGTQPRAHRRRHRNEKT